MTFKTFTLATALVAAAFTTATPAAFAMENVVSESRAKIERILASQDNAAPKVQIRASTLSTPAQPEQLDRYEAAKERLFGNRAGPSGR